MGREIKRVALNFNWPIGKIWNGYQNPYGNHIKNCPVCKGRGVGQEYYFLECLWYAHKHDEAKQLIETISNQKLVNFGNHILGLRSLSTMFFNWADYHFISVQKLEDLRDKVFLEDALLSEINNRIPLSTPLSSHISALIKECYAVGWNRYLDDDDVKVLVKADRLWDFTRIPINEEQEKIVKVKIANGGNSWLPFNNGRIPTPEEINAWSCRGFGHDSINSSICIRERLKRAGIDNYQCSSCKGNGELKMPRKFKKACKNWTRFDPPEGKGYQLWSTTTEGHPMSPVFDTPEKLAEYLSNNNVSSFGDDICTYEQWLKFIVGPKWAPSAIVINGELKSGVEFICQ